MNMERERTEYEFVINTARPSQRFETLATWSEAWERVKMPLQSRSRGLEEGKGSVCLTPSLDDTFNLLRLRYRPVGARLAGTGTFADHERA